MNGDCWLFMFLSIVILSIAGCTASVAKMQLKEETSQMAIEKGMVQQLVILPSGGTQVIWVEKTK